MHADEDLMGFQAGPQAEEMSCSVVQGVPGTASQAGLAGLDTANARSILWDPQDPLLGTPDLVGMLLILPWHGFCFYITIWAPPRGSAAFTGQRSCNHHSL